MCIGKANTAQIIHTWLTNPEQLVKGFHQIDSVISPFIWPNPSACQSGPLIIGTANTAPSIAG